MKLFPLPTHSGLFVATLASLVWLAGEQAASAQVLAQAGGTGKTAIGWALTLLGILLGLVVVLRPTKRVLTEKKKQQPARQ